MKFAGSYSTLRLIIMVIILAISEIGGASPAQNLDELLHQVKQQQQMDTEINKAREAEFIGQRDRQQQLLAQAKAQLLTAQTRSADLRKQFDAQAQLLAERKSILSQRMGDLAALFVTARQAAGDTAGVLDLSLVSAQYPDRDQPLLDIVDSTGAIPISALRTLWYLLQQEMTESAKVVRFSAGVIGTDGREVQQQVTRVGVFNVLAGDKYLRYSDAGSGQLVEMLRQPAIRVRSEAMAIDPTAGRMLSLLVQTPTLLERIQQGRWVGYIIIVLAIVGMGLGLFRWASLVATGARVRQQARKDAATSTDNPLGRILSVYSGGAVVDTETLERKLDEAIIRELPALSRGLSVLKILAVTAPLLGLLGTVTGMIETFQSITLFGTGDPKLMAGGISQALVTTVLGLSAAIPLTFLHALVSARSRGITQVLEEQSAGIIARHAESRL